MSISLFLPVSLAQVKFNFAPHLLCDLSDQFGIGCINPPSKRVIGPFAANHAYPYAASKLPDDLLAGGQKRSFDNPITVGR